MENWASAQMLVASEPQAQDDAQPEHTNPTVVVAEDESVNRMDLVAMLEDNGYDVVGQAANGEEAIALTRAKRPMATARAGRSFDSSYGLVTYAIAPAPMACLTKSVCENAVSMTTGAMFSSQITPAAVMPSICGILTSMHTTSGRSDNAKEAAMTLEHNEQEHEQEVLTEEELDDIAQQAEGAASEPQAQDDAQPEVPFLTMWNASSGVK